MDEVKVTTESLKKLLDDAYAMYIKASESYLETLKLASQKAATFEQVKVIWERTTKLCQDFIDLQEGE